MRNFILTIALIFIPLIIAPAQTITLDRGFESLTVGITSEAVENYIGFKGKTISRQEYIDTRSNEADLSSRPAFRMEFDECIIYNHIMPVPVAEVFLKDNRVISIEINSLPSFSRPICLETQTMEGVTFWQSKEEMLQVHGEAYREVKGPDNITNYYYDSKGTGFGLANDEIRIIYFFEH